MMLRGIVLILLIFGFMRGAEARGPGVTAFLQASDPLETTQDIAGLLAAEDGLPATSEIWREALAIGRSDKARTPTGRAAIVRLNRPGFTGGSEL